MFTKQRFFSFYRVSLPCCTSVTFAYLRAFCSRVVVPRKLQMYPRSARAHATFSDPAAAARVVSELSNATLGQYDVRLFQKTPGSARIWIKWSLRTAAVLHATGPSSISHAAAPSEDAELRRKAPMPQPSESGEASKDPPAPMPQASESRFTLGEASKELSTVAPSSPSRSLFRRPPPVLSLPVTKDGMRYDFELDLANC
jgi:hypothetical protein